MLIPRTFFSPLSRELSRLVLGTSLWRGRDQPKDDELFDRYAELGGNCIDTALVYYDIEHSIGDWMMRRQNRSEMVVIAKIAHHETVHPEGVPFEYHDARVTPECIEADLKESLRRLKCDYIDILVLHRDDRDEPVGPIIECLAKHQASGVIRSFGASNWSIPRLEEAQKYATEQGIPGFVLSSPQLSLAFANEPSWPNCVSICDAASRDWYRNTQTPLFAWSCLALGFFAGDHHPVKTLAMDQLRQLLSDRWTADVMRVFYSPRNFERRKRAVMLAEQRGVTATQIALCWLLQQGSNVFAVVGPRSPQELLVLAEATSVILTDQELAWLDLKS